MTLSYGVSICNKLRFTLKRDLCQPNLIRSITVRMINDSINHLLHLIACSLHSNIQIMLPLYDNGKGSNYDLQHFIKSKAPNRARWDYHTVHIQQLNVFKSVRHEEIFAKFASRWLGYLNGHYSDHN